MLRIVNLQLQKCLKTMPTGWFVVAFVCSLVFFQCAADRNTHLQSKKSIIFNYQDYQLRQINPNELLDIQDDSLREVSCSNEDFNNIGKQVATQCHARKRVVPLKAPVTMHKLISLHPSHVEVNWCSGYCEFYSHGSMTCMPIQLRTIEIAVTAVMLKSPSKTESKCFIVKVQEHESCVCNCSIQEKHCNLAKQSYNKSRCRCECKDTKQHLKCEKNGRVWDPATCECQCPNVTSCSTGSVFDPLNCGCAKIVRMSKVDKEWRNRMKVNKKNNSNKKKLKHKQLHK